MTSTPSEAPDARNSASGARAYASPDPTLQLIAEGVTELVGYGAAVINIRRGDEFEVVAATGDEEGHTVDGPTTVAEMLGTRFPVSVVTDLLEMAVDWGDFKFVPHELNTMTAETKGYWVPDTDPDILKDVQAWHTLDELLAPFYDHDGKLVGLLSIDRPTNGLRPGRRQQRILNRFARQARRTVLLMLQREYLEERANNLMEAQRYLREASAQLDFADVLDATQEAMSRGLDADGLYVQAEDGSGEVMAYASPGLHRAVSEETVAAVNSDGSTRLWTEGQHAIVNRDLLQHTLRHGEPERQRFAELGMEFLDAVEAESMLVVPIGVESTPLGHLVLLRGPGRPRWTDAEGRLAMEFGRDFGRIVITSNAYSHERELAERLATADKVHSRLIESVALELRRPLAALSTGIEAIRDDDRGSPTWFQQVGNLISRSDQLVAMVDDLLLFSRFSDPMSQPTMAYVDLTALVAEIVEQRTYEAEKRGITIGLDAPELAVPVLGDRSEIKAALLRLVDNALVYTHRGGQVQVNLVINADEAAISVIDNGVGIAADEQSQVFTEFYRGRSQAIGGRKGVGLGLSIVDRVARRHDGRVTLRSEIGTGTRVSLVLPRADDITSMG